MYAKRAKDKAFYVSNIQLNQEYLTWYENIKLAQAEGIEEPQIPDFIVQSMMRIANKLSYKPNFINYTFKEDMVSDALYDCVRFAKKFNPEKSTNPFSYITTICFNAFLRRIDKEKSQRYIKAMIVNETDTSAFFDNQDHEANDVYANQYIEFLKEVGMSDDAIPMSVKRGKKYQTALAELEVVGPLAEFEND
jgi:DNA-directed RNA polymerase specialized sigma24 family protein